MIDYARPYEQNMCELYFPPSNAAPGRLDDFQGVFRKGTASHIYGNYYSDSSYDAYAEPDIESTASVYHNLVTFRDHHRDDWKKKFIVDWTEDDTVSWIIDAVHSLGINEYEVPYQNFRVTGYELRNMKREDMHARMQQLGIDQSASRRLADTVYEKLQHRYSEDVVASSYDTSPRNLAYARYPDSEPYLHHEPSMLDLDSLEQKNRGYPSDYRTNDTTLMPPCDSSDEAEDTYRSSPEHYGSDGSKSGDEDDKRKMFKRPPGRPKGSGRKLGTKRPKSVSVPEFLRNLLFDRKYCPSIIKWEDHSQGKFRFVKPDEVAKLWGKMKQNDNMTFEKFSRAMRYHYRQSVLVSVPTARLVYQFGPKGPDFKTDNPNFQIKSEHDRDMYS